MKINIENKHVHIPNFPKSTVAAFTYKGVGWLMVEWLDRDESNSDKVAWTDDRYLNNE